MSWSNARFWLTQNAQKLAGIIIALLVPVLFALTFINKYAPITEGWWHVYGRWILQGRVPYRDFELLVPPVFPWIISLTQVFGIDSFLSLRILGLLVLAGISATAFFLLYKTINGIILGSIVATSMVYLQMGAAYISYDYVYFSILFLLLTFLPAALITRSTQLRKSSKTLFWASYFAGVFAAFSFCTKQTHGLVAIFFGFIAISVALLTLHRKHGNVSNFWKSFSKQVIAFPVGVTSVFIVIAGYLFFNNALNPAIDDLFYTASQTKGGISTSLFRWTESFFSFPVLIGTLRLTLPLIAISLLAVSMRSNPNLNKVTAKYQKFYLNKYFQSLSYAIVILFAIALGLIFNQEISMFLGQLIYLPIILMLFLIIFLIILHKLSTNWLPAALASFALIWASGMSAGLGETAMFLGIATVTSLWIGTSFSKLFSILLVVTIATATICAGLDTKNSLPYSWWGLNMTKTNSSLNTFEDGLQKGLSTDIQTSVAISGVKDALNKVQDCPGEIVAFPDIPLFQLDQDVTPQGRVATYWFDFSSQNEIKNEIARLTATTPKAIVTLNVPEFVLDNHESLFNSNRQLNQRELLKMLNGKEEGMTLKGNWELGNEYSLSVYTITCD